VTLSSHDPGFAEATVITGYEPSSEVSALIIRASVPTPMETTAGGNEWGVTVFNPTNASVNVTRVSIGASAGVLGTPITAVKPATTWTRTSTTLVNWSGTVTVPPQSAADFIVISSASALRSPTRS